MSVTSIFDFNCYIVFFYICSDCSLRILCLVELTKDRLYSRELFIYSSSCFVILWLRLGRKLISNVFLEPLVLLRCLRSILLHFSRKPKILSTPMIQWLTPECRQSSNASAHFLSFFVISLDTISTSLLIGHRHCFRALQRSTSQNHHIGHSTNSTPSHGSYR